MNDVTWVSRDKLLIAAKKEIRGVDVVLDIGCGIMPQRYVLPKLHICCEPYQEYVSYLIEKLKSPENSVADYLIFKMGWQGVVEHFSPNSVDTVFLVDVIEHLDKDEAKKLLEATQKIARHQVVIFTPWGFMPQHHADGKDAWGLSGGDWQEHKSGWLPDDFEGDGWKFIASKDFHMPENFNELIQKPYGAFWAIKTNSRQKLLPLFRSKMIAGFRRLRAKFKFRLARAGLFGG